MNPKNLTQKFKITVLTPVHIGSGFRKMKGIDFYYDDQTKQVVQIDLDEIGVALAGNHQALNELANLEEQHDVGELIRRYHLKLKNIRKYPISSIGKEYFEFIRTGLGQPFIPGSSLKGSLRTAILRNIFNQKNEKERIMLLRTIQQGGNPKYAANDLLKKIFGKDPNYDLMRTLTVTDSCFKNDDLLLTESRVLSQDYRGWHWKPLKSEQGDSLMRVWCEALYPGHQAEIMLSIDNFLLNDPGAKDILKFPNHLEVDFTRLMANINQYSRQMLNAELNYFAKRNDEKDELKQVLNSLEAVRKHIPESNKSMVIRLGWGSGWESMTGALAKTDRQIMEQVRRNFRLGRDGMDFPKTRKIAFNNNQPAFPFGWIKLEALK
jgi:CRISPR-associated protein Csm5